MGVALAPADRLRMAKLLGMLGSSHAGERDAAGLAADRLRQTLGATWADILAPAAPPPDPEPALSSDWRAQAADAARYTGLLSRWERNFLHALQGFQQLSAKQEATLRQILAKVHAA